MHPSSYYHWLKAPKSQRTLDDELLTTKIKTRWEASDHLFGYRNIHLDLIDDGIVCGRDRVLRLMRQAGICAQRGYKKPKGMYGGKTSKVAENILDREFKVEQPNQWWVSDITYIHTHEGFLYLAVVMDLFARVIVGWSMSSTMTETLVKDAILMAYWRRKPQAGLHFHSDQGSQYTSNGCGQLLIQLDMTQSMSRRGNCWDNAVSESFFANLKKEKIRRKAFKSRKQAKAVVFNYIEMFYNPKRRHTYNNRVAPLACEQQYFLKLKSV